VLAVLLCELQTQHEQQQEKADLGASVNEMFAKVERGQTAFAEGQTSEQI